MSYTPNKFRQSEISTAAECRRKHHFNYTLGVTPVGIGRRMPSEARDIGSAAHVGVAALNEGKDLEAARDEVVFFLRDLRCIRFPENETLPLLTKEDDPEWWNVWRYADGMTQSYAEWRTQNDIGIKIHGVEEQWEVKVPGTDFTIFGTIDLIFHDPLVNGIVIRDNKGVSTFKTTPEEVDFQLRTYAWAYWRMTGIVPKRVEHLMMKRVLFGGTAKGEKFERYPVPVSQRILENHEKQLIARLTEIDQWRTLTAEAPVLYPNPSKDCSWRCSYRDVCPAVDDGSDWQDMVDTYFVEMEALD